MMTIRRTATLALLLVLALAPSLAAQEEVQPGLFSDMVDVRVVNIEVVVTDRDGVPVRGLDADAFVLEVDGQEVPVDYFSEVRGGQALLEPGGGVRDLPAVPALVPGEPVGTSYLVFIDDFFTFKEDRDRVLDGLEADLDLLGEKDQMALVAFDGRQLVMLSSWTRSRASLERALDTARARPTQGLMRLAELREFDRGDGRTGRGGGGLSSFGDTLDPETKAYVLRLGDQIDRMLSGAAATLRSFAKPPGRKVMILINGGWPYSPTEFVTADYRGSTELGLVEGDKLFRQVSDTANLLGFTVYPADASGQGARWSEDPTSAARAQPGSTDLYSARRIGRQFSSRYLASETGGQALLYDDAEHSLNRVVEDTRSYYWLGFSPTRAWDDRNHEVKIRTRDGQLEARTRQGFLDSSRTMEVNHQVESMFLFGSSPEASELDVVLGEWRKAGFRKMEVPLTFSLPLSALTFVPDGSGFVAEFEVRLAVENESTFRRADTSVIPFRLEGTAAPGPDDRWEYTLPLRLRRQSHRGLIALYDVASGKIISSDIVIEP